MATTLLKIKLKPEEIPWYFRDKFYELWRPSDEGDEYVGWVHIKEDGTIEFGEPGA